MPETSTSCPARGRSPGLPERSRYRSTWRLRRLHISADTLNELIEYGIVTVREGPEGKYFSADDVKVLNLAKEFFRFGVEPRHLRMYHQFVGREASFIEQIIRPQLQHKDPNTKRSAIKDLENLMALSRCSPRHFFVKRLPGIFRGRLRSTYWRRRKSRRQRPGTRRPGRVST